MGWCETGNYLCSKDDSQGIKGRQISYTWAAQLTPVSFSEGWWPTLATSLLCGALEWLIHSDVPHVHNKSVTKFCGLFILEIPLLLSNPIVYALVQMTDIACGD